MARFKHRSTPCGLAHLLWPATREFITRQACDNQKTDEPKSRLSLIQQHSMPRVFSHLLRLAKRELITLASARQPKNQRAEVQAVFFQKSSPIAKIQAPLDALWFGASPLAGNTRVHHSTSVRQPTNRRAEVQAVCFSGPLNASCFFASSQAGKTLVNHLASARQPKTDEPKSRPSFFSS